MGDYLRNPWTIGIDGYFNYSYELESGELYYPYKFASTTAPLIVGDHTLDVFLSNPYINIGMVSINFKVT